MKLPWDKEYLKISFHVIFTLIAIYAIGLILKNASKTFEVATSVLSYCMAVLGPFFTAIIFAYIMDPVVERLQGFSTIMNKRNTYNTFQKRTAGTALTYIAFFGLLSLGFYMAAKKIGSTNLGDFADKINKYLGDFSDMLVLLKVKLTEIGILKNIDGLLDTWLGSITESVKYSLVSFIEKITKAGGWILNGAVGLTAAYYFLVEKEKILFYAQDAAEAFLPKKYSHNILGFFSDTNRIFKGYICGQIMDAIIMAVLISISFTIAGINYAIIIGLISGFSNLIPYVGAIVAFLLAVGVGLISDTPIKALYAAIIVLIIQQVDSMYIVPKIVGKSVELPPVLVILSLSFFGGMFGIGGMIVAVPCTAIIKVLVSRVYRRRKNLQTVGH